MKKLSLYLETSVWNFIFADDAPEIKAITLRFFSEIRAREYEIYISDLVVGEIGDTNDKIKKQKLESLIKDISPIQLVNINAVQDLTIAYQKAKVTSQSAIRKALLMT